MVLARAGDQPATGRRRDARQTLDVALVVPLQGSAGLFGPSCELCAEMAVLEVNEGSGLLGRELRLRVVDGGDSPERVADRVDALVSSGEVDAVTGWHISAVRQALVRRLAGRVPYVYTALYEGGEQSPGVFLTGETPAAQVLPALRWLAHELGVRRWAMVGNDYVWPRASAAAVRRSAAACGIEVRDEVFVPLGCDDYTAVLQRIERCACDGLLMLLVGQDAVRFNQQFAAAGLDALVRLSPLMDENMIMATGAASTAGLYASAGYFEALPTADSLGFNARFARLFGNDAPVLNSLGESCYEGITLLAQLARHAQSLQVGALEAVACQVAYRSPRGSVSLRNRHLQQEIYLAKADGMVFDLLCTL